MSARVLVVDDLPLNLKLLEAKLALEYYDVVTAADGLEALERMRDARPDIVLLDVTMPGMDGFEVCRRIKADRELMHVPVVMVTALGEPRDRVQGLEAGADDFLTKPINDIALFARVRSLLRMKLSLDELRLRDHTAVQFGAIDDEECTTDARVLVVDDDASNRRLIERALSPEARVICTDPADLAPGLVAAESVDLIIVNLGLAGCDGLRLCARLRSSDATRTVPLLMLVEEDDTERLVKGLDLGINDYLYRPIDPNELIARARSQVRHKRYQDRLRGTYQRAVTMSVTDSLTGLYNRGYLTLYLDTLLHDSIRASKPLALAMVDVDHFKAVNDTHGHAVGDEVLCEVAQRLVRGIRASDLAARLGGEEFVVVMPNTEFAIAREVAGRLRRAIAEAVPAAGSVDGGVPVTVSVGVAAMGGAGDTPDALLKRADDALYEAKRGGRNRVIAVAG